MRILVLFIKVNLFLATCYFAAVMGLNVRLHNAGAVEIRTYWTEGLVCGYLNFETGKEYICEGVFGNQ